MSELIKRTPFRTPATSLNDSFVPPQDNALDFGEVLRNLWRRKLLVLTVAVLAAVPGIIAAFVATPLYNSSALIQINPDSVQVLPYRDIADSGSNVYYEVYMSTQDQILKSPTLLNRVVDRLKSDPKDEWLAKEIPNLGRRFTVRRIPNSQLFQLGYSAPVPEAAARIVNLFTEEFIKQHLEVRQATRQKATESLQRELEGLEQRLHLSEKGLLSYAQRQDIIRIGPGQGDLIQKRVATLDSQATEAESDVGAARRKLEALQSASAVNFPERLTSPVITGLNAKILQAEQDLAGLRVSYGENWPSVTAKRNEIALLREQLTREKSNVIARETEQAKLDLASAIGKQTAISTALTRDKDLVVRYNNALIEYNIQQREVDTNRKLYEGLLERLSQTSLQKGVEFGNVQVVDPGRLASQKQGPGLPYTFAWTITLGLTLGVGVAWLRDFLDNTVSSIEEAQRLTALPALGIVPAHKCLNSVRPMRRLPGAKTKSLSLKSELDRPASSIKDAPPEIAEAVRDVCASILLSQSDSPLRVIVVSSAAPAEGKSTMVEYLGRVLAESGAKTLLIDGDLREPVLSDAFGIIPGDGLSLFLSGHIPAPRICETAYANLFVAPAGPHPPNPVALLGSEKMSALIQQLASEFRFVVIDSPPVLAVADARVLASKADGLVLIVRAGATSKRIITRARAVLLNSGVNVLGIVLNACVNDFHTNYYRRYYEHTN